MSWNEASVRQSVHALMRERFAIALADNRLEDLDNWFEAGVVDSFGLIELISQLEATFNIKLSDNDLMSPLLANLNGVTSLVLSKFPKK